MKAVTAPDGAHLVVAGAGTGKTLTLVHRLAWLIHRGVPASKIVLLTFTRKAAGEMVRRAADLVGEQATRVRASTFHSFALTALRRYAPRIGFNPRFNVVDDGDARDYMGIARGMVVTSDEDETLPKGRTLKDIISRRWTSGKPMRDVLRRWFPEYIGQEAHLEKIALIYQEKKKAAGVMDFDDLLLKFDLLLSSAPDARERLAKDCEHILVDEYQDTDVVQARIIHQLASVHGNIMAVGDDAQSIYGFRGAEVANMLEFSTLHANCSVLMLEDNYRSTQQVLDVANALLAGASGGYEKALRSHIPDGPRPVFREVLTEYEQAEFVAEEVHRRSRAGESLDDMAVLFRSKVHANALEVILHREGIPYRMVAGRGFMDRRHVRDVVALLRIVNNDRDSLAWFRVLQFFEGVGQVTASRIAVAMDRGGKPELDLSPWSKKRFAEDLASLASLVTDLRAMEDAQLPTLLQRALEWYMPHMERLYEDHRKRRRDFEILPELAKRRATLADLVSDLALDPKETVAEEEDDGEQITLSTVHSAKGLEWRTVFVIGMSNQWSPFALLLENEEAFEEERRVIYVALTRAAQHLTLVGTHACRLLDGMPSRLFTWRRSHESGNTEFGGHVGRPYRPSRRSEMAFRRWR